jgi:hypothetical protein
MNVTTHGLVYCCFRGCTLIETRTDNLTDLTLDSGVPFLPCFTPPHPSFPLPLLTHWLTAHLPESYCLTDSFSPVNFSVLKVVNLPMNWWLRFFFSTSDLSHQLYPHVHWMCLMDLSWPCALVSCCPVPAIIPHVVKAKPNLNWPKILFMISSLLFLYLFLSCIT